MGKPIQKKWFGPAATAGSQIVVNGVKFADGTVATSAFIVKQTGSSAYIVQDTAQSHEPEIVFMVNAASTSTLLPGQCFILATPFGGSALPCAKIAQYRVDIFDTVNTVPREVGAPVPESVSSYSWSTVPATAVGEADLISGAGAVGAVLSVAVNVAGFGYFTAPTVTFTGGGSGATATASIASGAVTGIVVNTPGTGYTTGGVTLTAPPARVTATGTAVLATNTVGSITLGVGGGYYTSAPTVTITGDGTGATATATVLNGAVTGFVVTAPGTGYTTATVAVAQPSASVQATATATISA